LDIEKLMAEYNLTSQDIIKREEKEEEKFAGKEFS
jgi:hypothetical protein